MNRCRQAEINISMRKDKKSSNSLGPKGQSFKKSVSSSCSGEVHNFGRNKKKCVHCKGNHQMDKY